MIKAKYIRRAASLTVALVIFAILTMPMFISACNSSIYNYYTAEDLEVVAVWDWQTWSFSRYTYHYKIEHDRRYTRTMYDYEDHPVYLATNYPWIQYVFDKPYYQAKLGKIVTSISPDFWDESKWVDSFVSISSPTSISPGVEPPLWEAPDTSNDTWSLVETGSGWEKYESDQHPGTFQLTVGATERILETGEWVDYVYQDMGDHYRIKTSQVELKIYGSYVEYWRENFTDKVVEEERWVLEYKNKQENWVVCDMYSPFFTTPIVDDSGVRMTQVWTTDYPIENQNGFNITWWIQSCGAVKHEISIINKGEDTFEFRVIQAWSGIAADFVRVYNGTGWTGYNITTTEEVAGYVFDWRRFEPTGGFEWVKTGEHLEWDDEIENYTLVEEGYYVEEMYNYSVLYEDQWFSFNELMRTVLDTHTIGSRVDFYFENASLLTLDIDEQYLIDPSTSVVEPDGQYFVDGSSASGSYVNTQDSDDSYHQIQPDLISEDPDIYRANWIYRIAAAGFDSEADVSNIDITSAEGKSNYGSGVTVYAYLRDCDDDGWTGMGDSVYSTTEQAHTDWTAITSNCWEYFDKDKEMYLRFQYTSGDYDIYLDWVYMTITYTAKSGWADFSYSYKQRFEIAATGSDQTNYQIHLNVYKGSGTSNGTTLYCQGHCEDDFDDLRFYNKGETVLLDYWIEDTATVSGYYTEVWVEVDKIWDLDWTGSTPNDGGVIYAYYGYSSAAAYSNGENTFLFWDHFLAPSDDLNTTVLWEYEFGDVTEYSVSSSILNIEGDGTTADRVGYQSQTTWTYNVEFRAYAKCDDTHTDWAPLICAKKDGVSYNQEELRMAGHTTANTINERAYQGGTGTTVTEGSCDTAVYHERAVQWHSSSKAEFYTDWTLEDTITTNVPNEAMGIYFWGSGTEADEAQWDWAIVSKVDDVPPTGDDWGSEIEGNVAPVIDDSESVLTNNDDSNFLCARKRIYIINMNTSDSNGYANIDFLNITITTDDGGGGSGTVRWAISYDEDTDTFSEHDPSSYITMDAGTNAATESGNFVNITVGFYIDWGHVEDSDIDIEYYVQDAAAESDEDFDDTADGSNEMTVVSSLELQAGEDTFITLDANGGTADHGGLGEPIWASGTVEYYGTSITPPDAAFTNIDLYYTSIDAGTAHFYDSVISSGQFNVTSDRSNYANLMNVSQGTWILEADMTASGGTTDEFRNTQTDIYITDILEITGFSGISDGRQPIGASVTITGFVNYSYDDSDIGAVTDAVWVYAATNNGTFAFVDDINTDANGQFSWSVTSTYSGTVGIYEFRFFAVTDDTHMVTGSLYYNQTEYTRDSGYNMWAREIFDAGNPSDFYVEQGDEFYCLANAKDDAGNTQVYLYLYEQGWEAGWGDMWVPNNAADYLAHPSMEDITYDWAIDEGDSVTIAGYRNPNGGTGQVWQKDVYYFVYANATDRRGMEICSIVFDQVVITDFWFSDGRVDINDSPELRVKAIYDFDDSDFGSDVSNEIIVNTSITLTWDAGNSWFDLAVTNASIIQNFYNVTSITDNQYGITAWTWAEGLEFDSTSSQYAIADSMGSELRVTGDLTLEFWFNPYLTQDAILFGTHYNYEYEVRINDDGEFVCYHGNSTNWEMFVYLTTGTFSANTWYHVVIVRDVSETSTYIFINGGSKTTYSSWSYTSLSAGSTDLQIGRRYSGSMYYDGMIGEIRIYNRTLSDAEAYQHYFGQYTDETGLVGHWKFQGDLTDSSGEGNTLTNNGATNCTTHPTYIVFDQLKVTSLTADDSRVDISTGSEIRLQVVYDWDDHTFDSTDSSAMSLNLLGAMTWDSVNSWWDITDTETTVMANIYNDIDSYTDGQFGLDGAENMDSNSLTVIWDQIIIISFVAEDYRVDINDTPELRVTAIYDYDDDNFGEDPSNTITVNSSITLTWDAANQWFDLTVTNASVVRNQYNITSIYDNQFGLTAWDWGNGFGGEGVRLHYSTTDPDLKLLTIECWINPAYNNSWFYIVNKQLYDHNGFWLGFSSGGGIYLYLWTGTGTIRAGASTIKLHYDVWSHLVVTYDGQYFKYYVNGALRKTYDHGSVAYINSTEAGCVLYTGYSSNFDGRLSHMRILNRSVDATEAYLMYNNIYNDTDLFFYTDFDGDYIDSVSLEAGTLSGTNTEPYGGPIYIVFDQLKVTSLVADDSRVNINDNVEIRLQVVYDWDDYTFDSDESCSISLNIIGALAWDSGNSWWDVTDVESTVQANTYNDITSYLDMLFGLDGTENMDSNTLTVIWDQLEVYELAVEDGRVDIGSNVWYGFKIRSQYDDTEVTSGTIELNSTAATYSGGYWKRWMNYGVISRKWLNVTSVTWDTYDITAYVYSFGYSFDGDNDDYVLTAAFKAGKQFAFECWFFLDDVSDAKELFGSGTYGVSGYFHIYINTNDLYVGYYEGGYKQVAFSNCLSAGVWHHLIITQDFDTRYVNAYVDGVKQSQAQMDSGAVAPEWSHQVYIGQYDADGPNRMDGRIGMVRFYNDTLDDDTCYQHYFRVYNDEADLLFHYDFFGDANDATGNGYDGTANGVTLCLGDPFYTVYDQLKITSIAVDDSRVDISTNIEYRIQVVYDWDDHTFDSSNSSTLTMNDLGAMVWDSVNSWWDDTYSSATVTSLTVNDITAYTDGQFGLTGAENQDSLSAMGIWDRVLITYFYFDDGRVDINDTPELRAKAIYDYDDTDFGSDITNTITVNTSITLTWDASNSWFDLTVTNASIVRNMYNVTSITDNQYGLTEWNWATAYYFDGVGDYLDSTVPSSFAVVHTDLSFEFWVRPETVDASYRWIVNILNSSGPRITVWWRNGRFCFSPKSDQAMMDYLYSGFTSTDVWYHIICTIDSGVLGLYVNGSLVDSGNLGASTTFTFWTIDEIGIGATGVGTSAFVGYVDDVRFYNRSLSADEVYQRYHGAYLSETGLCYHLKMDGDLDDAGPNDSDAVIHNDAANCTSHIIYIVFDQLKVTSVAVDDTRVSINDNVELRLQVVYDWDDYTFDDADSSTMSMNLVGAMTWDSGNSWWDITITNASVLANTYNDVDSYTDGQFGLDGAENMDSKTETVIWDRVELFWSLGSMGYVAPGGTGEVRFAIRYEYDLANVTTGNGYANTTAITYAGSMYWWNGTVTVPVSVGVYTWIFVWSGGDTYGISEFDNSSEIWTCYITVDEVELYWSQVDDSRVDINANIELRMRFRWTNDSTAITGSDASFWYNYQGGANASLAWDAGNTWWEVSVTSASVTSREYYAYDHIDYTRYAEAQTGFMSYNQTCIWDSLTVTITIGDSRIDASSNASISVSGVYDYDGAAYDGTFTLNDTTYDHSVVDIYYYTATVGNGDDTYGITVISTNDIDYVIFDSISGSVSISDRRINIATTVSISATAVHDYDGATYTGTFTYNDTDFAHTTAGLYYYNVSAGNGDDTYGITIVSSFTADYVVFDSVTVTITGPTDSRIGVGDNATISATLVYDYDGATYDGFHTWNDTDFSHSDVGAYGYNITAISGDTYGITTISAITPVTVIFDRVEVYYSAVNDTSPVYEEYVEVRYKLRYEYDSTDVTTGTVSTIETTYLTYESLTWDGTNSWWDDTFYSAYNVTYAYRVIWGGGDTYGINAFDNASAVTWVITISWGNNAPLMVVADCFFVGLTNTSSLEVGFIYQLQFVCYDVDGFAEIDFAYVALYPDEENAHEWEDCVWAVAYFGGTTFGIYEGTWHRGSEYITLLETSFVYGSGDYLYITFNIYFKETHPLMEDIDLLLFVEDRFGSNNTEWQDNAGFYNGDTFELDVTLNNSTDPGDPGDPGEPGEPTILDEYLPVIIAAIILVVVVLVVFFVKLRDKKPKKKKEEAVYWID